MRHWMKASALAFGVLFAVAPALPTDTPDPAAGKVVIIIDTHARLMRGVRRGAAVTAPQALGVWDAFHVTKTILLPPPFPPGHPRTYGRRELEAVVPKNPERFAFAAGGESLNSMIHAVAPENVRPEDIRTFEKEALLIVDSGAVAFRELAAEHLSSGRGRHPYESTRPDHPLLLVLADIAARHAMPIDLHMEAVPRDMDIPERMKRSPNPERLKENISGLERLLAHNRNARIIWAHAGWDLTGERTATLMRSLLAKHPNLYMSIKVDPRSPGRTSPFTPDGTLRPVWAALLGEFPDRFMIGSDQFFDEGSERLALARKLIDLLPPDIARRVASENAQRIYRLDATPR